MAYREHRSEHRQKKRVSSTGALYEAQNRSASKDFVKNLHQEHRWKQEAASFGHVPPKSKASAPEARKRIHPLQKHYDTLGLSNDSSIEAVKKSYRSLALLYHPDKNRMKSAEAKFRQIHASYSILINSIPRKDTF